MHHISDHAHRVQGLAWDPLGQYLASQAADRSVLVYRLHRPNGPAATRLDLPPPDEEESNVSAQEQGHPETPIPKVNTLVARKKPRPGQNPVPAQATGSPGLKPASNSATQPTDQAAARPHVGSAAQTPDKVESRITATTSTQSSARIGTGTELHASPAPPVPPEEQVASPWSMSSASWRATLVARHVYAPLFDGEAVSTSGRKLYGDEAYSPFFRRLAFAPDGSLLITPAGIAVGSGGEANDDEEEDEGVGTGASKCHNELRGSRAEAKSPLSSPSSSPPPSPSVSSPAPPSPTQQVQPARSATPFSAPAAAHVYSRSSWIQAHSPVAQIITRQIPFIISFSPVRYTLREAARWPEAAVKPSSSSPSTLQGGVGTSDAHARQPRPASVFGLPYRLVYAIGTADSIWLHDTQQAGPLGVISQLHYAPLTDLAWSPDGRMLFLSSRDGYCSALSFGPQELGQVWTGRFDPLAHAKAAQEAAQAAEATLAAQFAQAAQHTEQGSQGGQEGGGLAVSPRPSADGAMMGDDLSALPAQSPAKHPALSPAWTAPATEERPTAPADPSSYNSWAGIDTDMEGGNNTLSNPFSPPSSLTPPPVSERMNHTTPTSPSRYIGSSSVKPPVVSGNNASGPKKRRIQPTFLHPL